MTLIQVSRVKILTAIVLLLLVAIAFDEVRSQGHSNTATQSVTLEVKPISKISVVGNPSQLIIKDEASGSNSTSISDENTKYSLSTNVGNMKIVASISDRMPAGTKLMIKLASSKAASVGSVDLSNAMTPVNVVTGISTGVETDQTISYTFAANADVTELPATSRMVTLTLTN
ncbi:MAG: hypothetical protein NTX44_02070 [Ignavibacteriales bacterium]|nr:hypothetical protein [Ignavibacteriales bacterium]